jgi:aldose 1-epimerase
MFVPFTKMEPIIYVLIDLLVHELYSNENTLSSLKGTSDFMNINIQYLGSRKQTDILQYILKNDLGMEVHLLNWGATIRRILLPIFNENRRNVVLSYADWTDYIDNPIYAGATLGPVTGPQHINSGIPYPSIRNWTELETRVDQEGCSLALSAEFPDGEGGHPGRRELKVIYTLNNYNALRIRYLGTTDRETYLNLSNQTYFNLSGDFTRSALEQQLQINSSMAVVNYRDQTPAAYSPCIHTPFDFSASQRISNQLLKYQKNSQLQGAKGYHHSFLLDKPFIANRALTLKSESSGYSMELYTDAPAISFYSGGMIDNSLYLMDDIRSQKSCALLLSPQDLPDAPHFCPERCNYTTPNSPYERTIIYRFVK